MNGIVLQKMTFEEARRCADEIKNGINDIGKKLLELHEGEGWEALGYANWRECAQAEFGYSQSYAYRLLSLEEVKQNLIDFSPIGEIQPITESQARHLVNLPPEDQPIVYQMAKETAPNGKVTAAHVQNVVNDYLNPRRFIAPVASDEYEQQADDLTDNDPDYDFTEPREQRYTITDEYGIEQTVTVEADEELKVVPSEEKHDSDEYYTPEYIIDAARSVLGHIDLDPASCELAQLVVRADVYYTKHDNGLNKTWTGNVWLNPPFSKPQPFVSKIIDEYEAGNVEAAIVLTNNSTETQWGQALLSRYPVCFVGANGESGSRISFWTKTPDEPKKGNRYSQMIFYLGKDSQKFLDVFFQYGPILEQHVRI